MVHKKSQLLRKNQRKKAEDRKGSIKRIRPDQVNRILHSVLALKLEGQPTNLENLGAHENRNKVLIILARAIKDQLLENSREGHSLMYNLTDKGKERCNISALDEIEVNLKELARLSKKLLSNPALKIWQNQESEAFTKLIYDPTKNLDQRIQAYQQKILQLYEPINQTSWNLSKLYIQIAKFRQESYIGLADLKKQVYFTDYSSYATVITSKKIFSISNNLLSGFDYLSLLSAESCSTLPEILTPERLTQIQAMNQKHSDAILALCDIKTKDNH